MTPLPRAIPPAAAPMNPDLRRLIDALYDPTTPKPATTSDASFPAYERLHSRFMCYAGETNALLNHITDASNSLSPENFGIDAQMFAWLQDTTAPLPVFRLDTDPDRALPNGLMCDERQGPGDDSVEEPTIPHNGTVLHCAGKTHPVASPLDICTAHHASYRRRHTPAQTEVDAHGAFIRLCETCESKVRAPGYEVKLCECNLDWYCEVCWRKELDEMVGAVRGWCEGRKTQCPRCMEDVGVEGRGSVARCVRCWGFARE